MGNLPFCPSSFFYGVFLYEKESSSSYPVLGQCPIAMATRQLWLSYLNLSVKIMFMIVGRVDQVK